MTAVQKEMMSQFVTVIGQPFFLMRKNEATITAQYIAAKDPETGLGSFFETFWATLAQMNVPKKPPDNWGTMTDWQQILWIRENALSTALAILETAEVAE